MVELVMKENKPAITNIDSLEPFPFGLTNLDETFYVIGGSESFLNFDDTTLDDSNLLCKEQDLVSSTSPRIKINIQKQISKEEKLCNKIKGLCPQDSLTNFDYIKSLQHNDNIFSKEDDSFNT